MGHSRLETTRNYLDEIDIDDTADALAQAASGREAQASTDEETEWSRPRRASKRWSRGVGMNPRDLPAAPTAAALQELVVAR